MSDENTIETDNDSEKDKSDEQFSLEKLSKSMFWDNLMEIQEENPEIMEAFLGLHLMLYHSLRTLITSFENQVDELETAILKQADDLVEAKGFSEYEREEMKRNFRREFDQYKSISERHSNLIWKAIERVQRLEDQEGDNAQ